MTEIVDVIVVDDWHSSDFPHIIIDALTASNALDSGEIGELVRLGLNSLALSGKKFVVVRETP